MRGVKPGVKCALWWIQWFIGAAGLLFFVGFRWGLPPYPSPPPGVRLEPLLQPITKDGVSTNNAAFHYLRAFEWLGQYQQTKESESQMNAVMDGDPSGGTEALEQSIAECQLALELIREGVEQSHCQMPLEPLREVDNPWWKHARKGARLLCCEARLAARAGDWEKAIRDCTVVVKLGQHCTRGSPVIGHLVGIALQSMGATTLRALVLEHNVPADLLRHAAKQWDGLRSGAQPVAETLRYELIGSKQSIVQSFLSESGARVVVSSNASHRLFDAAFGQMIAEVEKPYRECDASTIMNKWDVSSNTVWRLAFRQPITRILIGMLLPALESLNAKEAICQAELDATITICAIQALIEDRGIVPDKLDTLVRGYLQTIPADPFNGEPFRYRRDGQEWVIWSVGSDFRDDNAAWHEFKYRASYGRPRDGDIYFRSTEPQDDRTYSRTRKPCP